MVFWYYEPSRPIKTVGGIKTKNQRGDFGTSWWARQWIESLEKQSNASRLQRGRSYARGGQVVSLEIGKGMVTAQVQGSRRTPYKITIKIKPFNEVQWQAVIDALLEKPYYTAKLLTQQMPEDIETLLKPLNLSLFPEKKSELDADCSCPDWEVPCKHLAAVYYILGEAFDDNPFFLFLMRGMEKETFLTALNNNAQSEQRDEIVFQNREEKVEPLSSDLNLFWKGQSLPEGWLPNVPLPIIPALPLKRLGAFPFWQGEQSIMETLTPLYQSLSDETL